MAHARLGCLELQRPDKRAELIPRTAYPVRVRICAREYASYCRGGARYRPRSRRAKSAEKLFQYATLIALYELSMKETRDMYR